MKKYEMIVEKVQINEFTVLAKSKKEAEKILVDTINKGPILEMNCMRNNIIRVKHKNILELIMMKVREIQ